MKEKQNWFIEDNPKVNSWWGFDYCFCRGKCKNATCGRNCDSDSYKAMLKSEPVHSESDFSDKCSKCITEEELIKETLERR